MALLCTTARWRASAVSSTGCFDQVAYDYVVEDSMECSVEKKYVLQDSFLNALRKERIPVSIFLKNGIKLQGTIADFDQFIVTLSNVTAQVVYKHAISTIVPSRELRADSLSIPDT